MKTTYTGRQTEFTPQQEKKLAAKLAKLAKLLDRKGEREAHVILTAQRHLQQAEITVRFHDHPLVGIAASADSFTAILEATDKLEKQALKLSTKWRDTKRGPKDAWGEEAPVEAAEPVAEIQIEPGAEKRVFRVNSHTRRKPMTLEEALLAMEGDRQYLVYRDAETDRVSVVLRRRDGHFDLIEA
jgi:ribosome hibernation promoting factor